MNTETIEEAFEYTYKMPQNSKEAFRVFCALNLISVGAKKKLINNHRANGIIRPHVVKVVSYALEHPELNLIDSVYIDGNCSPNCIFIICMGVQFSYHNVPLNNEVIISFCSSEKNIPIPFDGIKKQPIAMEMFELAKELLSNESIDRAELIERVNRLKK